RGKPAPPQARARQPTRDWHHGEAPPRREADRRGLHRRLGQDRHRQERGSSLMRGAVVLTAVLAAASARATAQEPPAIWRGAPRPEDRAGGFHRFGLGSRYPDLSRPRDS